MKKRYILCLKEASPTQDNQLIAYLNSHKVGWWHWISNVWLIRDPNGALSATIIRDKLLEIYPGVHNIVLELNEKGDTWSGFGPKGEEKNMFKWLLDEWAKSK